MGGRRKPSLKEDGNASCFKRREKCGKVSSRSTRLAWSCHAKKGCQFCKHGVDISKAGRLRALLSHL